MLVAQLVMLFTVRHSKFKLLAKAGCHHTYDLVEVLNHLKEGAPRQASQEKRRNWQGNAPALDNKGDQSDNHYKGDSEDVDGGEIKFDHVTAENLHSGCSTDSKARGRCEDGGSDDASSNNKTGDARPHNLDTFTQESEVEVVPDRHHTTNNGDTSNAHKDANSRTSWHHQLKSTLYRSFAKTPARPLAPPWVRPASVATWSNTVLGHNQYVEGVDDDDVDDIDEELDFSNSDSDDDVSVRATKLNHDIQRRSHHRTRSSVLALPHESNVHLYRSRASSYDSSIFHTMQVPLTPEELREGVFPWDDSHLTTLCMEISLIVECFYMSLVIVYDTVPWYKEFSSFAATFFFVATVLPQLIGEFPEQNVRNTFVSVFLVIVFAIFCPPGRN